MWKPRNRNMVGRKKHAKHRMWATEPKTRGTLTWKDRGHAVLVSIYPSEGQMVADCTEQKANPQELSSPELTMPRQVCLPSGSILKDVYSLKLLPAPEIVSVPR